MSTQELLQENARLRAEVEELRARYDAVASGPGEQNAAPAEATGDRGYSEEDGPLGEEHFHRTFENAAVGIAYVGTDDCWLYANATFSGMLGYARDELARTAYRELAHPDDREVEQDLLDRLESGEIVSYRIEKRYLHRDGHVVWANQTTTIYPDTGGAAAHFGVVVVDITEHKRAEQALRERQAQLRTLNETLEERVAERTTQLTRANEQLSRAQRELTLAHHRLRAIIDSTGDSICAVDAEYRLLVFNERYARGFERRFGYRPHTGMDILGAFAEHPDLEQVRAWWTRALGGEAYDLLREVDTADGEKQYYDVCFTPIRDDAGHRIGAVSVTRNITRLKQAEERLRRYNDDLSEANRQLEQSNRALQRSNRELQDFAYIASHDLQEPLRKIQTFSELVLEEHAARLGSEGQFFLQRMHRAASRMSQLIHDLLAFSRVQTHARPFEKVDLAQGVREVLADLQDEIEACGAEISVGPLPQIEAEPVQMRQLLSNLLSNAIKFRRREVPLRIRVEGHQDRSLAIPTLRLVVEDNGIGFDEKYLDRIFAPFERLHGRNTYGGTGIGLAICRRIAERHGGHITATSREGEGSRFVVTLPMRHAAAG